MARYACVRCEEECNTLSPPHLCKDVQARLREAERRAAVPCQGTGSGQSYLTRMNHEDPAGAHGPRAYGHDWVLSGHPLTWTCTCHPPD